MSTVTIQEATRGALEELTDPARGIVVEALPMTRYQPRWFFWPGPADWRVPVEVTESCSNDTRHGKGYCYGPTGDALCLSCMVSWIELDMVAGRHYSIEVAA